MSQKDKIRLLIADDHEMIRSGVKALLAGTEIKVVAEAATGQAAVKYALEHDVDVVLLDVRMPDGDGLTALGRMKLDKPNLPILMFSAYDNPMYVARAVALGASGYLLKDCTRDELLSAIRRAAAGENIFTRSELRRTTGALATPRLAADVEVPLTQREGEVLRQMAKGLTNKQIAEVLHISYETVKEHVQHILAQDRRHGSNAGGGVGRTQGTCLNEAAAAGDSIFRAPCQEDRLVTKKDIVQTIAEELDLTQLQTQQIVQKTFDSIVNTLVEDGRVELRNFGVFEVKRRKARKARNPLTGEKVMVPERYAVTFKPGKAMQARVEEERRRDKSPR